MSARGRLGIRPLVHPLVALQLQSFGLQQCIHCGKDLIGQFVALQQMSEPQDARFTGYVLVPVA